MADERKNAATSTKNSTAAAGIPNLLETLRATKASRTTARNSTNPPLRDPAVIGNDGVNQEPLAARRDRIVQQTDDDAAGSRVSAVELGYLNDPYAHTFWIPHNADAGSAGRRVASQTSRVKRMPIINRGTYVRTQSVDTLVSSFLTSHASAPVVQIISLGAGTDTRFFRLMEAQPGLRCRIRYHELDFAETTSKKIRIIAETQALSALIGVEGNEMHHQVSEDAFVRESGDGEDGTDEHKAEKHHNHDPEALKRSYTLTNDNTSLHSQNYHIHALDLRDLVNPTTTIPTATSLRKHLDTSAPTLILSEMCLTYLPAEASTKILRNLAQILLSTAPPPSTSSFPDSASTAALARPSPILPPPLEVILYESLHPHDAFGRTMLENLAARGIELPGFAAFPTLEAHGQRLVGNSSSTLAGMTSNNDSSDTAASGCGFTDWQGWTVRELWRDRIDKEEKERLRGLELIDEEEEWELLAGHYGIVRAWRWRETDGRVKTGH